MSYISRSLISTSWMAWALTIQGVNRSLVGMTPTLTVNISRLDSVPNDQLVAPVALWFNASVTGAVGFNNQPISEPEGDTNVYDPTALELFHSWSTGETYTPVTTPNVPLTHRDTTRAFCKRPCLMLYTPGDKTISYYVYDSAGNWGTATYTFAADGDSPAIADPDTYFSGDDTIFFSKAGIYPAEVPSGALTTDSESAVNSRITSRTTATSGFVRVRLRRGEDYADIENIGSMRNVYFDSYGDPAQPRPKQVRTGSVGPTTGAPFAVTNENFGSPRLIDQDFEGPYDAATETGRYVDGPLANTQFTAARVLIHRCRISGARIALYPTGGTVAYDRDRVISDCEITNWESYGIFTFPLEKFAIIGSDLHQKVDALNGIHQGSGNGAPTSMGNQHGPIRVSLVKDMYIACTSFFSRNGWSALSDNSWTVAPPTAEQSAFRQSYGSSAVNTVRNYHAYDRCSFEGGASVVGLGGLGNPGTATVDFDGNVLVESCLFVATSRTHDAFGADGEKAPMFNCRAMGQSIRNSYFYLPDVTYRHPGQFEYLIESSFTGNTDPAKPTLVAHFNNTGFIAADVLPGPAPVGLALVDAEFDATYLDNNVYYAPNLGTPIGTNFAPLGTAALAGFVPRYRGNRWNFRPIGWANGHTATITVSDVREGGPGDVAVGEWVAFDYPDYTGLCRGSNADGPLGQVTEVICEGNSTQYHQISVFDHPEKAMAPAAAGGSGSVVFDFTPTKIRVQNNSGATWSGASYVWVLLDLSDHLMDFDAATASPLTIPAPVPASGSAAILETASGLFAQRDFFGNVRQGKAASGQAIVTGKPIVQGAMAEAP